MVSCYYDLVEIGVSVHVLASHLSDDSVSCDPLIMKTQSAATVFAVRDIEKALAFYADVLGFVEDFRFGEYAGVRHGDVFIHLSQSPPSERLPGAGAIYIFCDEVDDFYREIKGKGAKIDREPKDWPYGMRDFTTYDLDGNQVSFGTESKNG